MVLPNDYVLSRGAACLSCRRKKQKCDGEKPICSPCVKSAKECIYKDPPKSKNQELIDKIRRLEEQIEKLDNIKPDSPESPSPPSPPSSDSDSRGRHTPSYSPTDSSCRIPSLTERVPGANMVWNYDPTVITNVPFQPSDLTPGLRQDLICIFLQHRDMCYFDLHMGRFIASLSLSSVDPQAPHPTLINAILLVGCYFSRDLSLAGYEPGLLAAANNSLATSFHQTDRLHDFIRASNLVAFYYFCKGLYAEAWQQIITSCHMTVSCGLHQITSSAWSPIGANEGRRLLLPYPVDAVEHGERIHTFWQTFCLDKMVSMAVGRPAQLLGGPNADPNLQISTPWPRLLSDYETGAVSDLDKKSVTNLYMNQMSTPLGRLETLSSLRSQGYALVYKALHFLSNRPTPEEIITIDSAIQNFTTRLPHPMNSGDCGEIPATPGLSPINHRIVTIHTLAHVASLILHQHGTGVSARRRCSIAAQGIASIIGQLNDLEYSELFIGLGHLWYAAGRILLTLALDVNGSVIQQNRNWALIIASALKRLSMVYPPLGFQLRQLQQIL